MPYRGLCACHEVCPVRDCSAPVVPRQEEFSGAATALPPSPFSLPFPYPAFLLLFFLSPLPHPFPHLSPFFLPTYLLPSPPSLPISLPHSLSPLQFPALMHCHNGSDEVRKRFFAFFPLFLSPHLSSPPLPSPPLRWRREGGGGGGHMPPGAEGGGRRQGVGGIFFRKENECSISSVNCYEVRGHSHNAYSYENP